ncbi:MAG: hypothetical protein ACTSVI_07015 [Promethearchaeota archaeon]
MAKKKSTKEETPEASPAWEHLKPIVRPIGIYSWVISLIIGISWLIYALVILMPTMISLSYLGFPVGGIIAQIVWYIICTIVIIIISIFYVARVFSKSVKAEEWQFLVDDVIKFGKFRLPKMLFFGIILEIFGYYAGIPILIAGLIIIFAGPVKMVWVEEVTGESDKVKEK